MANGIRCRAPSGTEHALQCGYCTPGMIMAAADLLRENPDPTEREVRDGLEGNLCRCTGYQNIVRAVRRAAQSPAARIPCRAGGGDLMTTDTQAAGPASAEVGRARVRKEDARLVTGQTNWTDNILLPGMLHMAFARSPYAHARITRVDLSAARAMPGVVAAFSGADFAGEQGSLPCAWPVTAGHRDPRPPADGDRRSPLRRRGGGLRGRAEPLRGRGRGDGHRRGLRAAARGTRHARRAGRRFAQGARLAGNKSYEFAMADGDMDDGLLRCPGGDRAQLPAAAADPHRDGAAGRGLRAVRRRVHASGRPPKSRTSCAPCSPW